MKTLTCSLIALAFATTAAHAQDATHADHTAPQTAPAADAALPEAPATDAVPATPSAIPPTADAGVTADAAAPAATPAPAPLADASATVTVTDAEVSSYVSAATKVQGIAADAALDEAAKQQQMAAAVTAAGLEPARFNEISTAINADVELRTRIQTAMAAQAPGSDG